jgi:galactokinase
LAGQASELVEKFKWKFPDSGSPQVFRAPGRINLIGDHTDYNEGFVLPMALELACWVATTENRRNLLRIHTEDLQQYFEIPVSALSQAQPQGNWSDYVVGVAIELEKAGVALRGQDLFIDSTIPIGAGLSSSAALEVATALALMGDAVIDRVELAKLCRRAENHFAGTPCGIMDQFIAIHGREGGAIKLDCQSLQYEPIQLPRGVAIVAVNSMVKHDLGVSEYRYRQRDCDAAVDLLSLRHPQIRSLRDVTPEMLTELPDGPPLRRARHVVGENMRVAAFAQAARQNNPGAMGKYMTQSHRSLKDDYEVSCPELNFLVDSANELAGVYGSRMTGGGFGGCTVNLVDRASLPEFRSRIRSIYQYRFGSDPQVFLCESAAGAGIFRL